MVLFGFLHFFIDEFFKLKRENRGEIETIQGT